MRSQEPAGTLSTEEAVRDRYSRGAAAVESALCCPVRYDPRYLEAIPAEVIERDYGCGDPTPFVRAGETVLDLGAGGGKVCFIASQIVGPAGKVIGVDCNAEMLALARGSRAAFARRVGYDNIEFRCGLIQDLRLDLDLLGEELARQPIRTQQDWLVLRSLEDRLRRERPLVADESVDCVVSNCVLNLVRKEDRRQLFAELFRVLRPYGRVAISDIVSDETIPDHLERNPELWSGCVSGAFREDRFLEAFEEAGFHGIKMVQRQREPWRVVEGIEFRSITVIAHKGKQGPGQERTQALIYCGPFRAVEDDDGQVFRRGERVEVCDTSYEMLQREPYMGLFEPTEPREEIPLSEATAIDSQRTSHEIKSRGYLESIESQGSCCDPNGPCC